MSFFGNISRRLHEITAGTKLRTLMTFTLISMVATLPKLINIALKNDKLEEVSQGLMIGGTLILTAWGYHTVLTYLCSHPPQEIDLEQQQQQQINQQQLPEIDLEQQQPIVQVVQVVQGGPELINGVWLNI